MYFGIGGHFNVCIQLMDSFPNVLKHCGLEGH